MGVDYIHISLWGNRAYASKAALGQCKRQSINKVIKSVIDGRALLIGAGDITSAEIVIKSYTIYIYIIDIFYKWLNFRIYIKKIALFKHFNIFRCRKIGKKINLIFRK